MHGKLTEVLFLRLRPHTPLSKRESGIQQFMQDTHGKQRKKKQFFFRQSATTIENSNNIYFSFFKTWIPNTDQNKDK